MEGHLLAMVFEFQDKKNLDGLYFSFLVSSTTLVIFFLKQITDSQIELLLWGWERTPRALSWNFFLNLSKFKSVTDYIRSIRLSPVSRKYDCLESESLCFHEIELLTPFLISWRKASECYCNFCYVPTVFLYFLWKFKYRFF